MSRLRTGGAWRLPLAVLAALPFVLPLVWLAASALKPLDQFYASPPTFLPSPPSLDNLAGVAALLDVPRLVVNSLIVATISAVLTVLAASLVGFAFATLPARGRGPLFGLLLLTIMVPPTATIVPQFILFRQLGWIDTWLPLILPHVFGSVFYVFLFRQWFRALPAHLFESAELDGANPLQAWRHVAMPLARPAVAVVAVFTFLGAWNDFLGPLVYLRTADSFTFSIGLATLQGTRANEVHHAVAGSVIALVPPVLLFLAAHRFLVRSIATTGWRA